MFADDFIRSEERKHVRYQASTVGKMCQHVYPRHSSTVLLYEYLTGGICKKIAILFVFCADVAMAVLKYNSMVIYVVCSLSGWVQQQGGWSYVFEASLDIVRKMAVAVGAGTLYNLEYTKQKG